jgi:hypothetical protein
MPALASYRDTVAERIKAGEPFGEVEDSARSRTPSMRSPS